MSTPRPVGEPVLALVTTAATPARGAGTRGAPSEGEGAVRLRRYARADGKAELVTTDRIVVRNKLSDTVAQKLESLIVAGEYAVGSKLPNEKVLAEQFGVGRSSMREAVRTLEAAGFLRSAHGVGVFVITDRPRPGQIDQSLLGGITMSDLFETRMAIESKAAELAARRLTDHHAELLRSIVAAAADPAITEADFVALDGRLHRQIAEASGNPLLLHVWDSISAQFEEYSRKVIGIPGRLEHAHADHCGIVDAIIGRDSALAAQRAHDHVAAVQAELQQADTARH